MVIRCIAAAPSREQSFRLGAAFEPNKMDFGLESGRRYVVLGLTAAHGAVWADIETGSGWPVTAPLMLFEVLDPRPSRHWNVIYERDESLALLPAQLSESTFVSRLADGDPLAVAAYSELCIAMSREAEMDSDDR